MFFRGHIVRLREAPPCAILAPRASCALLKEEGMGLLVLGIPFFRTWPCRLQLMGFQYRGSVASCESRRARTSCPRSWWGLIAVIRGLLEQRNRRSRLVYA